MLAQVGYSLDPGSGTLGVGVEVDNSDGRLRPGLSATASVELDDRLSPIDRMQLAGVISHGQLFTRDVAGEFDDACHTETLLRPRVRGGL